MEEGGGSGPFWQKELHIPGALVSRGSREAWLKSLELEAGLLPGFVTPLNGPQPGAFLVSTSLCTDLNHLYTTWAADGQVSVSSPDPPLSCPLYVHPPVGLPWGSPRPSTC